MILTLPYIADMAYPELVITVCLDVGAVVVDPGRLYFGVDLTGISSTPTSILELSASVVKIREVNIEDTLMRSRRKTLCKCARREQEGEDDRNSERFWSVNED
jgi:hypothetical protein